MKRLMTLCLSVGLLGACAGSDIQEVTDWEPQIRAANDALLNRGDLDMVPQLFAESYVAHVLEGDVQGREGIAEFVAALRDAFPDLRVEIEVLATEGDRVAWLRTARGTHEGDFMGVPATGQSIVWQDMIVTRYVDGLIAEEWAVSGLGGSLRQP